MTIKNAETMNNSQKLLNLIKQNPDLKIVPMVDEEVVADDCCSYWMGEFGEPSIEEVWIGKEHVHIKSIEDEEDVLYDMEYDGNIYDLSDDEWNKLYESVPWKKVIVVYILEPRLGR